MKNFFSRRGSQQMGSPRGSKGSPRSKTNARAELSKLKVPFTVFEGQKFLGGTFKRCVEFGLLAGEDRVVLYGYRHFSSPAQLLDLLTEILQNSAALDDWLKGTRLSFDCKGRVTKMLLEWINIGFSQDFQPDPQLVKKLHKLLESVLPSMEHNRVKLALLKGKVDPHGLVFPDDSDALSNGSDTNELVTGARFFLQQDADAISAELSYIDFELYRSVEASELMDKNWQRTNASELSPNLVALRKRFNQLSFWVISVVLKASDTKAQQIKLVKHLLDCAWDLYQSRNYNSMGAIVSGLSSVSLSRLKYLWEGLGKTDKKHLEELNSVLEVAQNFKVYRNLLEVAAQNEVECIPYIPLHLRDMLAIYEREESFLDLKDAEGERFINYDKMFALGGTMHTILQYRGIQWKPSQNPVLRDFLIKVPFFGEDDLLESSDMWKESGGEMAGGPVTPGAAIRCQVYNGYCLIQVSFEAWVVILPFNVTGSFKDLSKKIRGITGRDCDLFYQTQGGLNMNLSSQKDMPNFLSSAEVLKIEAIYSRGTISRRSSSRMSGAGSSGGTVRSRSSSMAMNAGSIFTAPDKSAGGESPEVSSLKQGRKRSNSNASMSTAAKSTTSSFSERGGFLSQSNSPRAYSPAMSPLMSPRGDEKRRIVLIEVQMLEAGCEAEEFAIPMHCSFQEFEALIMVLMGSVEIYAVESSKELGNAESGTLIREDSQWQRVLKGARDGNKRLFNLRKRQKFSPKMIVKTPPSEEEEAAVEDKDAPGEEMKEDKSKE